MQSYDTIVIGLGSAGVMAATTLVKNGKRVLGLEAQGRVGGRVHSVPFGDGIVEVGAEWIHGDQQNRVYNVASKRNIVTIPQSLEMTAFRSDGREADTALVNELLDFCLNIVENAPEQPEALGTFITKKLTEHIADKKPQLQDHDFITEFLEFTRLLVSINEVSNDWNNVSTSSAYEELEGPQLISWHRYGYTTLFEIMLNKYNNGPGLPNLDVRLNTEVVSVTTPQRPHESAVVMCKDGSSYDANNVIVTVALGVLKASTTLFSPPLPKEKQIAIDKISMGVVGKIILSFDQPWWPQTTPFLGFIWKGADKRRVASADSWTTRIYAASRPMGSSNALTLWTSGEVAMEVETLPEDVVKRKCVELLQRFIGDRLKVTVPAPTGIIRSTWHSNPYTLGSCSFDSTVTAQCPGARACLGAPLTDSAGAPRVLFAGEATSIEHYGTVHGACETGYKEAMRILNYTFLQVK